MPENTFEKFSNLKVDELYDELVTNAARLSIKKYGFSATLRELRRGRLPKSHIADVKAGVIERSPSGRYDAALETDSGRFVLTSASRTDLELNDPQVLSQLPHSHPWEEDHQDVTPEYLISLLQRSGRKAPTSLLAEIELTQFEQDHLAALYPALKEFVEANRQSKDSETIAAVHPAIRKMVAVMPMSDFEEINKLLQSGSRVPLTIETEIELTKSVGRFLEVHPPAEIDLYPELASTLFDMAVLYSHERLLPNGKHSAIASLAIEAVIALRSSHANKALLLAARSRYPWFSKIVSRNLNHLASVWRRHDRNAEGWLVESLRTAGIGL